MTVCITTTDILNLVKDGHISLVQGRDLLRLVAGSSQPAKEQPAGAMDIAIIGMSGRFPGADSTSSFWDNLKAGRNSVAEIPASRWDSRGYFDPDRSARDKSYSKWAGLVDDIKGFDADFFNISPREALLMDPQQRLFFQEAWGAIEDAGYAPGSWSNSKCGVFVGCVTGDYLTHLRQQQMPADAYSLTGNASSILAARLSYFLNLKGPAVAVDTACSSSLVSVHMACESLLSGTCDVALAGGVMLYNTPELFVLASQLGMLSPDGLCKTFDERANGIVISEAVGVVVLKPLAAAERDGDIIHAVIRASGINQDGKTPGITVPSAYAQTQLLSDVYARAGIDPRTIGYVEAHGTGTRLGDPIELEALTAAFRQQTEHKQFCAIGSVKTNIGHAQVAAGITSLIKAVLCLRHQTLPPSLHLEQPNRHIDFANSPFFTLDRLQPWAAQADHPRRACVSSLGFSGTNAHLVLEEYVPAAPAPAPAPRSEAPGAGVAVLSARTPERLVVMAERLLHWLDSGASLPAFRDVLHTLQSGRDPMPARLALLCDSLESLAQALRGFLAEGADRQQVFVGGEADEQGREAAQAELAALPQPMARDLARLWVAGAAVQWSRFAPQDDLRRVPLPTYAFAATPYWAAGTPGVSGEAPALHPILSRRLSGTAQPGFSHRFDGSEVYLKDHLVSGAPTLLGVSHLEMAITAQRLAGAGTPDGQLQQVQNVAWIKPVIVTDQPRQVQVDLQETERGTAYRVSDGAGQLYSQGRVRRVPAPSQVPRLDLAAIKARCTEVWPARDCYRIFDRNDLVYGPGLRTLETLYFNASESLARLILPEALRHDLAAYTLHPSLMDGALQSLLGLLGDPSRDNTLYIPYALGEITVYAPLTATCHAYARVAGNHGSAQFAEKRFDIDLLSDDGQVLAAMRSLSYRPYSLRKQDDLQLFTPRWQAQSLDGQAAPLAAAHTVLFTATQGAGQALEQALGFTPWRVSPTPAADGSMLVGDGGKSLGIDPRSDAHWQRWLDRLPAGGDLNLLFLLEEGLQGEALLHLLYQLLPALVARQRSRGRLLFVSRSAHPDHCALAGFARVLRHEHAGLSASVLDVSEGSEADAAQHVAQELGHAPEAGQVLVRYRQQLRQVQRLEGLERAAAFAPQGLFRQDGVYLISGGAGALGLQIARHLRRRFAARVILCGRSAPDRVAPALAEAEETGLPGVTRYLQADVSRQADVAALHQAIQAEFGALNGVLHAAGAIRDSLIVKQDLSALGPVLDPKFAGVRHLDEATRADALDLFLVFSSISSLAGTVGQSAYAYANQYLDHFVQWRDEQVRAGQRQGKSLAVNWPYWRDGGMRISEQNQTLMRNVMGVQPLSLEQGLEVLLGLSPASPTSICVAPGDRAKIEKTLGMATARPAPAAVVNPHPGGAGESLGLALGQLAADILRRDASSLRPQVALADYGFDSITYVELANRINRDYALDITPALFFEHKTLDAVAQFLTSEYALSAPAGPDLMATLKDLAAGVLHTSSAGFNVDSELGSYGFDSITYVELANKLNHHYSIDITPALFFEHKTLAAVAGFISAQYPQAVAAPAAAPEPGPAVAATLETAVMAQADSGAMPIAIIGMAGVLPGSPDLERFWEHLLAGDDMITTVPAQRWSWEAIYGDPAEGGKTRAKWGGFIDDVDKFDSLYFNISPHEAKLMDPSQRLILETVFSAIGNAGYASTDFAGRQTSVFIGVGATDYLNLLVASGQPISAYSSTGLSHSVLANRISYLLGTHGPSQPVDTACSSSLVALHRAVESIRNGCEMAIAGGVNLILSPFLTLSFSDAGMLSEDGRCMTFSDKANGYVRGEGAGAVLLKPLHKAIADGDNIHAVIRATAENHGGRASSLTAPNPVAQAMLLVDAYTRAGVDPATVTCIETHGTGTPLGDPIEINGLKEAFATLSRNHGVNIPEGRCGLGAVKTHIGHLEAAAGMAGLFKIILSMQHRTLPGNLHFQEQNPYIKLAGSPFYIIDRPQPWAALSDPQGQPIPRRAGVSSLSFSGANAHVVLEEYVAPTATPHADSEQLVVLSARTRERLLESLRRLARHLEKQPDISLANLAYTLQVGRDPLAERLALVVGSVAELAQRLGQLSDELTAAASVYWNSPDDNGAEAPDQLWEQALAASDLHSLARLWTRHRDSALDWRALPRPAGVRRVALPGYPFARIRHWAIDEPPLPTPPAPDPSTRHTLLTFAEHWQPALAEIASAAPEQPRLVLCCLSDPDHQAQLRQLAAMQLPGSRLVFLSRRGHGSADSFVLDPQRVHELSAVLGAIVQQHGAIDGLLYLWPLEAPELARQPVLLVNLVQALVRLQQNLQRVLLAGICRDGADRCQLESWIGLERSMPRILAQTAWQTLLLESTAACDFALAGQERASACFEPLLAQWRGGASGSSLYVGHQRYQLSMQRLALVVDETAQPAAMPSARANTWLITGGSGHLGLLFADHLARTQGSALRLALVGRSAPTPVLEQRLQALAASGAQVRYWQADVTDFAAMEQALIQARAAFGPLQGFIHAAGVEEGPGLLQASAQAFQTVLAPKVAGSEILDALTAGDPLVHACYFSSTAALLGDMGAASYAMGNRFLMAHATYRNQRVARGERHGQTIAINWPLWKDGGMGPVRAAVDSEQGRGLASYLHSSGQALLTAQQGLAAFEAILHSGLEHAAVACGDASRLAQLFDLDTPAQPEVAPRAEASPASAAIDLHIQVLSELQGLCSDVAQIPVEELPGDATLSSFGFDSINLARLAKKMQQRFGFAVSPALFFSHPTLARLAGHLAQQHATSLTEHYRAPVTAPAQAARPSSEQRAIVPAPAQAPGNGGALLAEPIAIIGASGRFPQCDSVDEMWRLLLDGRSAVSAAQAPNGYSCGSLRGVDEFDPLFFGISPRAAQEMDPRQRLLLEESWRALEDAAIGPRQLASHRVGVFVGLEEGEYFQLGGAGSITANHSAIAASHLAYFLDLDGPVMTLNTACSSGLVALHQACQSLRLGECEMALVSSANLMLTRQSFTRMDQAGMLSPDGRCHTFDQRANGMVPGEAVVALVVKPLSAALADGDPIVSVIAASKINYDGKTNGITAPNGAAQARLLASTYEACNLAPRQIDYVVTHGTGTALGDAVEVNALAQVFGHSQEGTHCALTSTKTNFGHCLAASGLVSTLCLASALRHESIPPSLNFETHNDFVDWQASAFFVNTTLRPWPVKADGARHGAVSAFGMSGTNAHVVLRDLAGAERRPPQRFGASAAYLMVLSARSILSLCDRLEQLIEVLAREPQLDLAALSHTLLDGRHHFEYRCALVAQDQASALDLLRQLASDYLPQARARAASDDAFPAQVFQERVLLGKGDKRQAPQPSIVRTIEQWVRQLGDDLEAGAQTEGYEETLRGLADFYCQGYALPWHLRYPRQAPARLQLPTYPFEHGRYWVDPRGPGRDRLPSVPTAQPLVRLLAAQAGGGSFVSTFTGQEFFLADHVVQGHHVLPGVAYLEMALQAASALQPRWTSARLAKVGWMAPLTWHADQARQVETRLTPLAGADGFAYSIVSRGADQLEVEAIVHGQGVVSLFDTALAEDPAVPAMLDIQALKARSTHVLSGAGCYAAFQAAGLAYGPACRVVEAVHCDGRQCLVRLVLPEAPGGQPTTGWTLHAALLDGALQGAAGFFLGVDGSGSLPPKVPFALERLDIHGALEARMWALLSLDTQGAVSKLDAGLYDDQGRLRVSLHGLAAREIALGGRETLAPIRLLRQWQALAASARSPRVPRVPGQHQVLLLSAGDPLAASSRLGQLFPQAQVQALEVRSSGQDNQALARDYQAAAEALFVHLKTCLGAGAGQKPLFIQVLLLGWPAAPVMLGLEGLLKTACLENPRLRGQLIAMPSLDGFEPGLIGTEHSAVWLEGGEQRVPVWNRSAAPAVQRPVWKDAGCYLITGGAGGLGRIFAREIIENSRDARIVLVGRSLLGQAQHQQLADLEQRGARVVYCQADIDQLAEVEALLASVQQAHGPLSGVIHNAGITADDFILNKTQAQFAAVLEPKVRGTANLDHATRNLGLEWFVLCASASGVTGNVGQADYAAANAFLDGFAYVRNQQVRRGERQGHTLAVDWSLWAEGRMRPDAVTEERLWSQLGIRPLSTAVALSALRSALAEGATQMLVAEGDPAQALAPFGLDSAACAPVEPPRATQALAAAVTAEQVQQYFKQLLCDVFALPAHRIDARAPLEDYGIDSIMVGRLTARLEEVFGPLSKTLFFEFQTLEKLCGYFLEQHGQELARRLAPASSVATPEVPPTTVPVVSEQPGQPLIPAPAADDLAEFAIVGLSGQYPLAADLQQYWANLRQGRDCITPIPAQRWNHERFYAEQKNIPGTTYGKWGGFIDDVDCFDTLFFNISAREAQILDPQERLFLQCAYHLLEDAGYTRATLAATARRYSGEHSAAHSLDSAAVGVFVGAMYNEYQLYGPEETALGHPLAIPGNVASIANRVSYFCNLHGPSVTLDTMCSSSLTAIHMACQSLLAGECALAIAGGVNVTVHPNKYLVLGQGRFLSDDGRCRSFGEGGTGYVPGEGVGAVLIRPLADALAQGDRIYGVIQASAINHGGKTNGYSVPNPNAQAALIAAALRQGRVDPRTISYVEAHGTGTALGDPIEIAGLSKALGAFPQDGRQCAIGSVKSNIGHTESAAGIAGLTKILLQFQHRQLVPSLHSAVLNGNIDFAGTPFRVQQVLADWGVAEGEARVAAVSSFGAGGSNAHLILREPSERESVARPASDDGQAWAIPLSARTAAQLRDKVEQLRLALADGHPRTLADIAHTLQVGREAMRERLVFMADSLDVLATRLQTLSLNWVHLEAEAASGAGVWREPAGAGVFYRARAGVAPAAVVTGAALEARLRAWVEGAPLDWANLQPGNRGRRIGLPLYPFAKERYWAPLGLDALAPARPSLGDQPILVRAWQAAPLASADLPAAPGALLILCTEPTLALARRLFASSGVDKHYLVHQGEQGVDFHDPDSTLAAYRRCPGPLTGLIDLTALDERYEASTALERGKLALLQAFVAEQRQHVPRLLLVTHGRHQLRPTLQGARTAGLYRMLNAEYRSVRAGVLDTDLDPTQQTALMAQIEAEFNADAEADCCYRQGERFVATFEPLATPDTAAPAYQADDVLLVTGGTGGIGAALVDHLLQAGARAIAIIGREPLPDAGQWPRVLAGDSGLDGRILARVRRLQGWVERGARVAYQSCNLESPAAIDQAIAVVENHLGPVTGVFHCAGSVSNAPAFIKKPVADMAAVCTPKISGLAALYQRLDRPRLRFFLMFSSVSASVPALAAGQSDYAMANAYMDQFALAHRRVGLCSVQWPAWAEVGMAVGNGGPLAAQMGLKPLGTAVGLSLLDRVLALALSPDNPGVCLPCHIDPEQFSPAQLDWHPAAPAAQAQATVSPAVPAPVAPASLLASVEQAMRELLMDELKFSAGQLADRDMAFADYGIESIMVLQLMERLGAWVGNRLDPSLMFEFTTLGSLSEHLASTYPEALQQHLGLLEQSPGPAPLAQPEPAPALAETETSRPADIAIIGLAVRLPGAEDAQAFWTLQERGGSAIGPMRDQRWPGGHGQAYGGWLDAIDRFDPAFFGLNPKDAAVMDPQARLMLEQGVTALFDAGYSQRELSGRPVGVYIGGRLRVTADARSLAEASNPILGVGQNYLASNLSRFFNLTGPSLVVDTACSSGLTAMSLACDALRNGSIGMALVGATSLLTSSDAHDLFSARNILSPDGAFNIFDDRAAGDVLGEGVVALVCKTLAAAQADGDRIYCVVKGLAVNNDGRTLGPGSPSLKAQQEVMRQALRQAGKTARDVGYIEVNGGGSAVVDAVEIKALAQVYALDDSALDACCLGSVKPSVGHLLLTSGLAGFVRCALSLHHRQIVPSACGLGPFEHFDFGTSRVHFNRRTLDWKTPDGRSRVAAQSCFPDGGTNCHVILEEFIAAPGYEQMRQPLPAPVFDRRSFSRHRDPAPAAIARVEPAPVAAAVAPSSIPSSWGVIHEQVL
ncbi:Acyl transferase domain-containing protein [Pseudomonas sp. LAMO17WK12:I10]|uniref:SDR family NAD(P)-dependent oxidoreductase n=1 Tax=unclassified Pseudomonas TaxID=196821 RepID=UPI000BD2BC25|nr:MULTISPECIES: SDR family NAD(P)-dependent oxidoreductase [unclassified Pseudomonas]PXX69495.1 acyl transferase domain-containing protein [Pseudomonas sp. LAMO17WK12:I9]SNY32809.1 Acyl transferase domain-containing protein [Pseudomonas sp. LAMO17WK12:I10]